jgi:hypothetical protein
MNVVFIVMILLANGRVIEDPKGGPFSTMEDCMRRVAALAQEARENGATVWCQERRK